MCIRDRLNDEQQQAFDGLLPLIARREAGAALLHGVTASGKTQVYICLLYTSRCV